MKVEQKQTFDSDAPENPKIPENYYETRLEEIISYPREGRDAPGLIIKFKVLADDVEVENDYNLDIDDGEVIVPFFAPAKLSYSESASSSRLTKNLMNIGLHDAVLDSLGVKEAVMENNARVYPESEEDLKEFKTALKGFLAGKKIKADISYNQEGDESQINKFSKVVEDDSSSESSEDSGSENQDVIFDDEEE